MEGTLIGDRYRLGQSIGQGRGGSVWIATDTRVQRTVAAKPIGLRSPEDAEFALQQAKLAARLRHQCAITVYDVVAEGDEVWLITEYVPSRTMADFVAEYGRITPMDTATLGVQIAAALAAAHETGLLHRAVEPPNVLLADDGGVQISDFGIGVLHGDHDYRAPEILAGGAFTQASDVFALGATLFYAVEGVPPFSEDGIPSRSLLAGTTLQPVVMRMLSADPAMRPSMEGVWHALRAVRDGLPTGFAPGTQPPTPAQPAAVPQSAWVEATQPRMAAAPQLAPQAGTTMRRPGLPSPAMIAVAVAIAVLTGVLFTELFLL